MPRVLPNPSQLRIGGLVDLMLEDEVRSLAIQKLDLAMIGFVYAVAAGFCAAIASTCAKLAMSPDLQTTFW